MKFNYSFQAFCIFMSRIIYKRLDANRKLIFRKFEKEIKVCTKIIIIIIYCLVKNLCMDEVVVVQTTGSITKV